MRHHLAAAVAVATLLVIAACQPVAPPAPPPPPGPSPLAWNPRLDPVCAPLPPPSGPVIDVDPSQVANLGNIVAGAAAGTTIRLADGTYTLTDDDYAKRLRVLAPNVTIRSASGDATRVVIDGSRVAGALVHVFANNAAVTDLTLIRARDHLVHIYPLDNGPDVTGVRLHRLRLIDSGEQFVKVNPNPARSAFVDGGEVSCSEFLMTADGRAHIQRAFGCYTGGIDAHSAQGWHVHHNTFEGIYCEDGQVAEHAVHFWVGSRDTVIEQNLIRNVSRGIGLGLVDSGPSRSYPDNPYPGLFVGHYGGVVRSNVIVADIPQYDTGIELDQARGAWVLHNTVVETANATGSFSSLDYRFANTLVEVHNNLLRRITARDGGQATLSNNVEAVPLSWFADPVGGDVHLTAAAAAARDVGTLFPLAGTDIDGQARGIPCDLGADEVP